MVYTGLLACTYASIAAGIGTGHLPVAAALALAPGIGAPMLAALVYRHADDIDRLNPLLGWNVALTLGTILLLGFGLLLG